MSEPKTQHESLNTIRFAMDIYALRLQRPPTSVVFIASRRVGVCPTILHTPVCEPRSRDANWRTAIQHNGLVIAGVFERFDSVGPGSFLIAFAAGILSFLSPCVLPLVPGYLSVITGLDIATLSDAPRGQRRRVIITTSLFITGFALVYVPTGSVLGAFGAALKSHQILLTRLSGLIVLAFAMFLGGSIVAKAPWIYQEFRFHPKLDRAGRAAPLILGAAFAFGWTPCIGPIAGSAATIAIQNGEPVAGAGLLLAFTLGLGVPFLVTGLTMAGSVRAIRRLQPHFNKIVISSACVMAVFGVLLITNELSKLTSGLSNFLSDNGMGWIKDYS